ncbi:MAG: putative glycolipid-binding domain-containing protein [Erythrobacter sp.]|nr:putative glycolipid-binding domain-containing protein [Erythrobacter sp.]NCQ62806.1 putative glycolipid-binding domain-containing protein [Alphaproteobacteria bacterium]
MRTLWRRLDIPGFDSCSIVRDGSDWRLSGVAEFGEGTQRANLAYQVTCNALWESTAGYVEGWSGNDRIQITAQRSENGTWNCSAAAEGFESEAPDIDLGFTPATNLNAIRRLGLKVGESAEIVSLWLDSEDWLFKALPQKYVRISEDRYQYRSHLHAFECELEVSGAGIVRDYPGLWRAID